MIPSTLGLTMFLAIVIGATPMWNQDEVRESSTLEVESLIQQIRDGSDVKQQIKATRELGLHARDPASHAAINLLEQGLSHSHADVRYESMLALATICNHRDRTCPAEILALADDPAPRIQANFAYILDFFQHYPPTAFEIVLDRFYQLESAERADALPLLAKTGRKDKRVMLILLAAVNSDVARERVNGTAGLWHATGDFGLVIPLYFDRLEDAERLAAANDDPVEAGFNDLHAATTVELGKQGVMMLFFEHLAHRERSFLDELERIAAQSGPKMRRKLARYLATCLRFPTMELQRDPARRHEFPDCDLQRTGRLVNQLMQDEDSIVREYARLASRALATLPHPPGGPNPSVSDRK